MKIVVGNAQHIGARQEQQDSFGFSDPRNEEFMSHGGFLGVVADGMGGLSHGSEASHAAVRVFLQTYESKPPNESISDALARSLIAANQTVVALADRVGSANGTGTTLAAAVLHGDSLHWISAGDSRVYLCHGNSLTRVTSDHVYARQLNEKVARGMISREEAQRNSERAALTSFLGDLKEVDRSLRPLSLRKGDRVIICSDGFYRAVSEAEIIEAFQGDPQSACDMLVEQAVAKQRNQQDNLTVIALTTRAGSGRSRALGPVAWVVGGLLVVIAAIVVGPRARAWWENRHHAPATSPQPGATQAAPAPSEIAPANPPKEATSQVTPQGPAEATARSTKHRQVSARQHAASGGPAGPQPDRFSGITRGKTASIPSSKTAAQPSQGKAAQGQAGQAQPPTGTGPPSTSSGPPEVNGTTTNQPTPESASGTAPSTPQPPSDEGPKPTPETPPSPTPPPIDVPLGVNSDIVQWDQYRLTVGQFESEGSPR